MNPVTQELIKKLEESKKEGLSAEQAVEQLKENPTALADEAISVGKSVSESDPEYTAHELSTGLMTVYTGLTALQLAQLAKEYKDDINYVAQAVIAPDGYPDMTATELGNLLLDPTLYPDTTATEMHQVLVTAGYSDADATAAVNAIYPSDKTYALNVSGNPSYLEAASNSAYDFGEGDFTLQCWVKTTESGTVIGRKSGPGGPGNGGFLLVIYSSSQIKLAIDNGFGFNQIVTGSTQVRDGSWHFVTGIRKNNVLTIYLDGNPVSGSATGNISPPLNINNSMDLLMGSVAQYQETYRQYAGQLDEVRIWNIALTQEQITSQMNTKLTGTEPGLVGYFTFADQNGDDSSPTKNNANPVGDITYTSPGALGS